MADSLFLLFPQNWLILIWHMCRYASSNSSGIYFGKLSSFGGSLVLPPSSILRQNILWGLSAVTMVTLGAGKFHCLSGAVLGMHIIIV